MMASRLFDRLDLDEQGAVGCDGAGCLCDTLAGCLVDSYWLASESSHGSSLFSYAIVHVCILLVCLSELGLTFITNLTSPHSTPLHFTLVKNSFFFRN